MKNCSRITPDGTKDWLFEECVARRGAEARLAALFAGRGFCEVMTPGLEFLDVFENGKLMDTQEMFKLCDNHGRLLAMRPDSTIPIARLAGARLQQASLPLRLYYAQDVYRMNQELSGHHVGQFQMGVELIGAAGERADFEVAALAAESLRVCGCERFRLELGHVGLFRALMARLDASEETKDALHRYIETKNYPALGDLLDTLPSTPVAEAIRRLPRLFGGDEVLAQAREMCPDADSREAVERLATIYHRLCQLEPDGRVMMDFGLVHRHEYYTGMIFRGYVEGSGETVVSGGRYDTLLGKFGESRPATGFGINVDALSRLPEVAQSLPPVQVLVHATAGCEAEAMRYLRQLNEQGTVCEYSLFDTPQEAEAYAAQKGIAQVCVISEKKEDSR